jgi:hypothetical protein
MTTTWSARTAALILDRTDVRQAHLSEALRELRTGVPRLAVVDEGRPAATLQWTGPPAQPSEPLVSVFWDFLALADAPDADILTFARRFGPLRWPEGPRDEQDPAPPAASPEPTGRTTPEDEVPTQPMTEPLRTWRMYARGLRALYDLVDPAIPAGTRTTEILTWSVAPAAIPLWLADPDRAEEPLEEGWLVGLVMAHYGLGVESHLASIAWEDRLLLAALAAAGVGPAYPADPRAGLVYTLPATPITADGSGGDLWQVRGLAPILTTSLAFAVRTQERPRCTRCGRPAAVVTRGPRAGHAWYGDHVLCRALSRAETIMKTEEKRAARHPAQPGENGA